MLKTRWFKALAGIVIFLAVIFVSLPFAAKYLLTRYLINNGAEEVTIERISYNPFLARITVEGLEVSSNGLPLISESKVVINARLISLLSRDVRLENVYYEDFFIDLEQFEDGRWRVGFVDIGTTSAGKEKVEEKQIVDDEKSWAFLADNLQLQNCRVRLKTPALDLQIVVNSAELGDFSTRKGSSGGFLRLDGEVEGSAVSINLDQIQVSPDVHLEGTVKIEEFQLEELSVLLQNIFTEFQGAFGMNGELAFHFSKTDGTELKYIGSLGLAETKLKAAGIHTAGDGLSWQGTINYGASGKTLKVLADGELLADDIVVDQKSSENGDTGRQASLDAEWKGKVEVLAAENGKTSVQSDGELVFKDVETVIKSEPFSLLSAGSRLSWKGEAGFESMSKDNGSQVVLAGIFSAAGLQADLPDKYGYSQEKLQVDIDSSIALTEQLSVTGKTRVAMEKLQIVKGETSQPLFSLGKLQANNIEALGGKQLHLDTLELHQISAASADGVPLQVDVPMLRLMDFSTPDFSTYTGKKLTIEKAGVAGAGGEELARLDELSIEDIKAGSDGSVSAGAIQLVRFGDIPLKNNPGDNNLTLGSAKLTQFSWSKEAGLEVDGLALDDLMIRLIREQDGGFTFQKRLAGFTKSGQEHSEQLAEVADEGPESAEQGDEKKPVGITINEIAIGGESSLIYEDYTLAVPYKTDLAIDTLQLRNIHSAEPEKNSELVIEATLEGRAPLSVKGELALFQQYPFVDLDLTMKNYPLTSLSSYTVQSIGTGLSAGQLQLSSSVNIAENHLDVQNEVVLQQLETERISEELAKELDNQLPVSLDTALGMLRDSQGDISLDVPVSGPIDEIDVGIADVLTTALSKAIVPAATGYLVYALGPYAALAYVGMKVGEKMLHITLPPVEFDAGESLIVEGQHDYLGRVAKILEEHPDPDVQVCPVAASWEFLSEKEREGYKPENFQLDAELEKNLNDLGQQRAMAVQSYLVENFNIKKNRLLLCETKIEEEKGAVPSVVMYMAKGGE